MKNKPLYEKKRIQEFDRIGEAVNYLQRKPNPVDRPASETGSHRWTGSRDMKHALELLEVGWPEGLVEMKGMVENIERVLLDRIPRPTVHRDLSGSDVDIGAYLSGEPENMLEWQAQPANSEGIKLVVNGSASAGVSARVIKARGAVVVATIHAMQMLEIPVELWGVWASSRDRYHSETRIQISRPGYELDIERVAFILAHPSMLRRIAFGIWEREEPKDWRKRIGIEPDTGYGRPTDSNFAGENGIYLGRMGSWEEHWLDTHTAVEWILARLHDFGVELEAA